MDTIRDVYCFAGPSLLTVMLLVMNALSTGLGPYYLKEPLQTFPLPGPTLWLGYRLWFLLWLQDALQQETISKINYSWVVEGHRLRSQIERERERESMTAHGPGALTLLGSKGVVFRISCVHSLLPTIKLKSRN